jgi:hypothetical protein
MPNASVAALPTYLSPHLRGMGLVYNHYHPWTVRQRLVVLNMLKEAET